MRYGDILKLDAAQSCRFILATYPRDSCETLYGRRD